MKWYVIIHIFEVSQTLFLILFSLSDSYLPVLKTLKFSHENENVLPNVLDLSRTALKNNDYALDIFSCLRKIPGNESCLSNLSSQFTLLLLKLDWYTKYSMFLRKFLFYKGIFHYTSWGDCIVAQLVIAYFPTIIAIWIHNLWKIIHYRIFLYLRYFLFYHLFF